MRNKLDEQLRQINKALIEMADLVQYAIAQAIKALVEQDMDLARKIMEFDDEVNDKEKEIENLCLKVIMQQHPVARDLRFISAVLKIITDLERIGDHASDISEISLYLAEKEFIKKLEHIPQMAVETTKMVADSIAAFVNKDVELATAVIANDDVVDDLFMVVKSELISLIKQKAENGDQALDLLMIAKYFERIGDHATNVAEWVIFEITGSHYAYK